MLFRGHKRSFHVLSRRDMGAFTSSKPYIVISIRNPDSPAVSMQNCPQRQAVLELQFDDANDQVDGSDNLLLFDKRHALMIKSFIESHSKDSMIVINCEAGLSRSAGVGAALSKFYNGTGREFFERRRPNSRVYSVMLNVLTEGLLTINMAGVQ